MLCQLSRWGGQRGVPQAFGGVVAQVVRLFPTAQPRGFLSEMPHEARGRRRRVLSAVWLFGTKAEAFVYRQFDV
jgi:hypothetical protein